MPWLSRPRAWTRLRLSWPRLLRPRLAPRPPRAPLGITASRRRPTTLTFPSAKKDGARCRLLRRRRARFKSARVRVNEPLQSVARALESTRIAEQPEVVMRGEHDPEKFEGDLPGIGMRCEMSFIDRDADRLGDGAAQLALPGDEQIAHGAGAIVVLGGGREHEAATGEIVIAF